MPFIIRQKINKVIMGKCLLSVLIYFDNKTFLYIYKFQASHKMRAIKSPDLSEMAEDKFTSCPLII